MELELVDQRTEPDDLPLAWQDLADLVSGLGRPDWTLNLVLVDDARMTELRERWYGGEGVTDVLSFSYLEPEGLGTAAITAGEGGARCDFWLPPAAPDEPVVAGEVLLAPRFVARRCRSEGWDLADEWALLTVHGALHILGWSHGDQQSRERMRAVEASLLARAGRTHPLQGAPGGDA